MKVTNTTNHLQCWLPFLARFLFSFLVIFFLFFLSNILQGFFLFLFQRKTNLHYDVMEQTKK